MIRDPEYLKHLRGERCILTGSLATDTLAVDPCHIGTLGRGIKSPDNEALPIRHDIHAMMHQSGEMTYLRKHAPNALLRAAFRALAREMYAEFAKSRAELKND